jgi:hypothetical protein
MHVSGQIHAMATIPWSMAHGEALISGWVCPRAGLDVSENRKISYSCRESNPRLLGHPVHSLVTILTELPRLGLLTQDKRRQSVRRSPAGPAVRLPTSTSAADRSLRTSCCRLSLSSASRRHKAANATPSATRP